MVDVSPGGWGFNGDYDRPTFSPSILVTSGHHAPGDQGTCWCDYNRARPDKAPVFECTVCHSFVTDGRMQFLSDCSHALAGRTVDLGDADG